MDQIKTWVEHYGIRIDMALGTVLVLAAASIVIFYADRFLRRLLFSGRVRMNFSYETILLAQRVMVTLMWAGVGMLILSLWGISVSGLWTVLASVAAIIGVGFLAVWTMVSNITASVFLTIWRPFYMGMTVEILPENLKGRVIDRDLMFTVLREKESGDTLHVPNNLFFQKIFRVTENGQWHLFEESEPRANNITMKMPRAAPPEKQMSEPQVYDHIVNRRR